MAALSQAVAGGLEVAAAALRGDDSSSSSHAEPEQRFAGFGALESVPDLKQGTSAWKRVRTPAQLGGKELRICQTGARLFIELDGEAKHGRGAKQAPDGLQLRRPLVGHRKVVVIDVLHVTNALRPVRRRCGYANARPPPSY